MKKEKKNYANTSSQMHNRRIENKVSENRECYNKVERILKFVRMKDFNLRHNFYYDVK